METMGEKNSTAKDLDINTQLVNALRSLERAIRHQCDILTRLQPSTQLNKKATGLNEQKRTVDKIEFKRPKVKLYFYYVSLNKDIDIMKLLSFSHIINIFRIPKNLPEELYC